MGSLAVACGGGGGESGADAGGDGTSNVTVIVWISDYPAAGIDVVFHAPDGAVSGQTTTDVAGEAHGVIVAGAQVTVVHAGYLTTFRRVDPGDTIRASYEAGGTFLADSVITLPGDFDTASEYHVSNGCRSLDGSLVEGSPPPVDLSVDSDCAGGTPPSFPVYAVARDYLDAELAWTLDPSVAVSSPDVTLPPWQTGYELVAIDIVEVPPGVSEISVKGGFQVGEGGFDLTGGLSFGDPSGDQSGDLSHPQLAAESYTTTMTIQFDGGSYGILEIGRADAVTQVTYDLGDLLLPRLSNAALDEATPDRPEISWIGAAPDADFVVASLAWSGGQWTIFDAPGELTAIQAPALPDELAALRPGSVDSGSVAAYVAAYEADWVDGYGELKEAAVGDMFPDTRDGHLRVTVTSL